MINRRGCKKRFLVGCLLGWLAGLALPFLMLVLVVVLAISIVSPNLAQAGSGVNQTNAVQTNVWTGKQNDTVVNAARTLVQTLYACGDNGYDKCYTAAFPSNVLQYLYDACQNPQCPYAQSGNFQCVFFVLAVYYMAHQTLPYGPNAVDFWTTYQGLSDWIEIPANGAPEPGDIAVFSGPPSGPLANPFGHVAVIIDVAQPQKNGTGGYIQLAEANSLQAIADLPLAQINQDQNHPIWQVTAWAGYQLLGYIRNAMNG